MTNTLHDNDRPNPQLPHAHLNTPDVFSPTVSDARTLRGCAVIVAFLVLILLVLGTVAGVGVYVTYDQVQKRAEAAQAEKQRLRSEAAERERQRQTQKLAAERAALAAQQALEQQRAVEAKRAAEEQLAAQRKLAEESIKARKKAEKEQEIQATIQSFPVLARAVLHFQQQTNGQFILPNGGQEGSGLSWRVHLLPYLGLMNEYQKFRVNEPWDSQHNLPLLTSMPSIFGKSREGKTLLRSFLNVDGQGWPYDELRQVTDGEKETIAIYYAGDSRAIEWTKPDDSERLLTGSNDLNHLANLGWNGSEPMDLRPALERQLVMLCDGSVATYGEPAQASLIALLTPRGGEVVSTRMLDLNRFIVTSVQESQPTQLVQRTLDDEFKLRTSQMEKIGRAMLEYRADIANSPVRSDDVALSWRVYLLPYLGEQELFAQFNLDESWDGPTNFQLVQRIPEVFQTSASIGRTQFCIASSLPNDSVDLRRLLSEQYPRHPDLVTWCYYVAPHKASYWTRPDHLTIHVQQTNPSLGWNKQEPILAGTLGGKNLLLPSDLHPSTKAALITRSNGDTFFDLEEALRNPTRPLRMVPTTNPPTPIAGIVELPPAKSLPITAHSRVDLNHQLDKDHQRLRRIAAAVHAFYDANRKSPTHMKQSDGQPSELSWRVHILPYLDQRVLYEQFDLNEPWNSTKNLQAAQRMPAVYGNSTDNHTDICILSGVGSLLEHSKWMTRCTDGLSNTIMLVQSTNDQNVTWTEPRDIQLDGLDAATLAAGKASFNIAMADGTTIPFAADMPNDILHALGTAGGGELIDAGTINRLSNFMLGMPAVSEAERRQAEVSRLQKVAMAMLNYESAFKYFPPGRKTTSATEPLDPANYCLSWRVHILPFLEMQALYSQFRLDEPWDSPHNLQLLPLMPDIYREAADDVNSSTTRLQIVTGEGSAFPEVGIGPRLRDISDGASNTLCVLIAPPSKAVPWTQPTDFLIEWATEHPDDLRSADGLTFSTFDGAVRRLPPDFDSVLLKSLMTSSGGEPIDAEIFGR